MSWNIVLQGCTVTTEHYHARDDRTLPASIVWVAFASAFAVFFVVIESYALTDDDDNRSDGTLSASVWKLPNPVRWALSGLCVWLAWHFTADGPE